MKIFLKMKLFKTLKIFWTSMLKLGRQERLRIYCELKFLCQFKKIIYSKFSAFNRTKLIKNHMLVIFTIPYAYFYSINLKEVINSKCSIFIKNISNNL